MSEHSTRIVGHRGGKTNYMISDINKQHSQTNIISQELSNHFLRFESTVREDKSLDGV